MKILLSALMLLGFTFTLNGCAEKKPITIEKWRDKIIYVKEDPYKFTKIDLTGVYIEYPTRKLRDICLPAQIQSKDIYLGVINYYENSIDQYMVDKNTTGEIDGTIRH